MDISLVDAGLAWAVWESGAYFGAGFHEDGLQAGLAVAEALGGVMQSGANAYSNIQTYKRYSIPGDE